MRKVSEFLLRCLGVVVLAVIDVSVWVMGNFLAQRDEEPGYLAENLKEPPEKNNFRKMTINDPEILTAMERMNQMGGGEL